MTEPNTDVPPPENPDSPKTPTGDWDLRLVRLDFMARMECELQMNAHKGDWNAWKPTKLEALSELGHHQAKLTEALSKNLHFQVREYAADVANIAMKIDQQFGIDAYEDRRPWKGDIDESTLSKESALRQDAQWKGIQPNVNGMARRSRA